VSTQAHKIKTFVCRQLYHSSAGYIISMEHKISVLYSKLYKCSSFHQDWIWLHAENTRFWTTLFSVTEACTKTLLEHSY